MYSDRMGARRWRRWRSVSLIFWADFTRKITEILRKKTRDPYAMIEQFNIVILFVEAFEPKFNRSLTEVWPKFNRSGNEAWPNDLISRSALVQFYLQIIKKTNWSSAPKVILSSYRPEETSGCLTTSRLKIPGSELDNHRSSDSVEKRK